MRYTGRTQQQHVSNPVWTYAYTGVHWIPALLIWSSGVSPPREARWGVGVFCFNQGHDLVSKRSAAQGSPSRIDSTVDR